MSPQQQTPSASALLLKKSTTPDSATPPSVSSSGYAKGNMEIPLKVNPSAKKNGGGAGN